MRALLGLTIRHFWAGWKAAAAQAQVVVLLSIHIYKKLIGDVG